MDDTSINISNSVDLPAQTIMTGRGCIIGQSGSGKSYLVGVMLEELCKLRLPFCVVDPEGEYYTLRNNFQVIVVGGLKGDVGLGVDFHALFETSIKNNLPVVLDLSESMQKGEILNRALSELYLLEEELALPYLVIVEEADKFAPQMHRVANMIEEIAVRGRKRGIGLLIVSQRPANVNKNVLAQCAYGLIGKLAIENDINAVSLFFSRSTLKNIVKHNPGEFSSFGLGVDTTIHVKHMLTEHVGATPKLRRPSEGEKLAKAIRELKKEAGNVVLTHSDTKQAIISAYSLTPGIDEEQIRGYAYNNEKKQFMLFGKKVESIDSISKKFISIVLAGLRLPIKLGNRNEYAEWYMMLDDKLRFVMLNGRLSFFQGPLISESKLLPEDYDILFMLAQSRRKDVKDISKELGMGVRAVHNSINRLKIRRLALSNGKYASIVNYAKYLIPNKPATIAVNADASSVINQRIDERIEKDWIKTMFPSAILFTSERVLVPIYEIRLRHGNKVRILRVEAVYGQALSD